MKRTNMLTFAWALCMSSLLGAQVAVVTTAADDDVNPPKGSLREAILKVNAGEANVIRFKIPGEGPQTIAPVSDLPAIVRPVEIDGYSQCGSHKNTLKKGSNARLNIELSGSNYALSVGLELGALFDEEGNLISTSDGSTIKGLVINEFLTAAILISGTNSHHIKGNFLGTDASGETLLPNGAGVYIAGGSDTIIGGHKKEARNVIAGVINGFRSGAVYIAGGPRNQVINNMIGTNKLGTIAFGKTLFGVFLFNGSDDTIISGNVVSGCTGAGLNLRGSNRTKVTGNLIGTDVSGLTALPNGTGIILIGNAGWFSNNTVIGGHTECERNIISGNELHGLLLASFRTNNFDPALPNVNDTQVINNYIGTTRDGLKPLGNGANGMLIAANKTTAVNNVSSANGLNGIEVSQGATETLLEGNFVGVDAKGENPLPNANNGVQIGRQLGAATGTVIK